MAARPGIYLLTILMFFTFNCKDKEESYLPDGIFHFVLHTDPSIDCTDCIMTGLKIIASYIPREQCLAIYLKKSKDNERFKSFLKNNFKERELSFYVVDLKVPHPSILLVKGKAIYMYLYIPNDPFLFGEYLSLCRDFFLKKVDAH